MRLPSTSSPTLLTRWAPPSPSQPTGTTVACGVRIVWFLMDCKECFTPHGHICCYLAPVYIMLLIVEPSLFSLLRTLVRIILSLWFMDFCHRQHKSTLEKIQPPKGCLLTLIHIGFGSTNCMLPSLLILTLLCQELTFSFKKAESLPWPANREERTAPKTRDLLSNPPAEKLITGQVRLSPWERIRQQIRRGFRTPPTNSSRGATLTFQLHLKEWEGQALMS